MTFLFDNAVVFDDSPIVDAFGRARVSDSFAVFDSQHQFNDSPLEWHTSITGGGTSTHLSNESAIRLRVANNGDSVIRQTREYIRYQPGKSQLCFLTGVLSPQAAGTGITQRIGYFDGNNGLFFEQFEDVFRVATRTSTSGSIVDNQVDQASFNLDSMDGTGPSAVTLDLSLAQIFVIDFEWLGVGRVRFGVVIDGQIIYFHEDLNSNNISSVFMATANLPVRYEISHAGPSPLQVDLKQICSSIISEGGISQRGDIVSAGSGATSRSFSGARFPLVSYRLKNGFTRSQFKPKKFSFLSPTPQSRIVFIELIIRGVLNDNTFSSVSTAVEMNTSATTITGGIVIDSFYATESPAKLVEEIESTLPIASNFDGTVGDSISIVVREIDGNSVTGLASLTWEEIYG